MRDEYSRRKGIRLPLILVVLSLASLLVITAVSQRGIRNLQRDITEVLDPATALVEEIEGAVAVEAASARGFVLSGDPMYGATGREARRVRLRASERLLLLARRMGPRAYAAAIDLEARVRPVEARIDSLFLGQISPQRYRAELATQQAHLTAIAGSISRFEREIARMLRERNAQTNRLSDLANLLTVVFALLALVAALEVARLGRGYRRLAGRLDEYARQQRELREAVAELSGSTNLGDAVDAVARYGVATTGALGAFVERAEFLAPDSEVEVVAAAGKGTPAVGARVPFRGSLTEALIESREPQLVIEAGALGERVAPYLRDSCRRCAGLVVPLDLGSEVRGTLVLVRSPGQPLFTLDEAAYAAALGDLASTTLRRVLLFEELRESEARFRQIADHLPEAIWLSDPGYTKFFYANPSYERIWGRGPEGRPIEPRARLVAVHPEDRERAEAALEGLPRGEYDIEYRVFGPDGKLRWVRSRGYPIRNERGVVYRVAGITEDITERKQAEVERERLLTRAEEARAEAERRRDELQRVTESRNRLMRGFSHDVKNPLSAADGFLQLLGEGVVDHLTPKQRESVRSARRSVDAALDLIDDLLEFARAESGEIEIERAPTDLRTVARDAAEQYRARAEAKGLSITVEAPDTFPVIESDASRIRQIVGNLLSNAVKFTDRGGITVRLAVRERGKAPGPGRWAAIEVSDTGPGITEEQQRVLFQEFRRLEPTGPKRGMGIGLAISRRIARALGGDVTVASEVGKGSTFTLWLPLGTAAERPDETRRQPGETQRRAAG